MYQLINNSQFHDAFNGRGRKDQFSYEAKNALFDYLEDTYPEDAGYELDVIGLCCDFSEDDYLEIASQYDIDLDDDADEETNLGTVEDYLQKNTIVVAQIGNAFVYQQF